jgi:adenosylhomocysteine nucleosidase
VSVRILVTFALAAEFAPWRRRHKFTRLRDLPTGRDLARCPLFEARFGGAEIVVALTGMGPVHARRAARYALQAAPDVCISSGLAGAVTENHHRGDVLAALHVAETRGKRVVACDPALVEAAAACGAQVARRFLTSPAIVVSAGAKKALSSRGDVVEMESVSVLAAASAVNVPGVAIRVVSDDADEDLPLDLNRVLSAKGGVRPMRLMGSLARDPGSLPGLLKLASNSRRASAALGVFLDRYVEHLAELSVRRPVAAGAATA